MIKLKMLWTSRHTWRYNFKYWYILMFPESYYTKWVCQNDLVDVKEDAWWFYEALNNFDNKLDFDNLLDDDYE